MFDIFIVILPFPIAWQYFNIKCILRARDNFGEIKNVS